MDVRHTLKTIFASLLMHFCSSHRILRAKARMEEKGRHQQCFEPLQTSGSLQLLEARHEIDHDVRILCSDAMPCGRLTLLVRRYFMPAAMNEEGVEVLPNNDLSDFDKAYAALNYPRDIASDKGAVSIVNFDSDSERRILDICTKGRFNDVRIILPDPQAH